MAAGKKAVKNNKTAHVLNLLTGPNAEAEGTPPSPTQGTEPSGTAAQAVPARPLTPPILEVARANDEHLSEQIRVALEEDFPLQAAMDEPAAKAIPEAYVLEVAPISEEVIPDETEAQGDPDVACITIVPESSTLFPSSNEDTIDYFNVMQTLVEEKAPRYIQMFGLCPCRRCTTDVKALALNRLQPKYVTIHHTDRIPMLTVYESRYSAAIFAQLTHACKVVMDNPRHEDADLKQG